MKHKLKNPFWFGLACLVWFLFRVGARPSRIVYPCQRVAAAQTGWFLSVFVAPFFLGIFRRLKYLFTGKRLKTTLSFSVIIALSVLAIFLPGRYKFALLKPQGNNTIPAVNLPAATGLSPDPVVSFRYDPAVIYGETPPYDRAENPAYDLVWKAIEDLKLGSSSNPLDAIVDPGDTVLIKVNLLGTNRPMYTHPAVVRPIIDMCILAGAKNIYVGDCGQGFTGARNVLDTVGYETMLQLLQAAHPDIILRAVSLGDPGYFRWVNIGSYSSFAGSGYTDNDMPNYNDAYFRQTDPYGVNPDGRQMAWYAMSDYELDATVIINVAKMKCHQGMINTLCIKNHVGSTMPSTYSWTGFTTARIPHAKKGAAGNEGFFANDIFWRAIADVNKILLYADRNGIIHTTRQRRYFNVVDAIQASEYDNFARPGKTYWRRCVLAGEDPVAVDAVASRVMCYNWKVIPTIHRTASETVLPIGTDDPRHIRITGSDISQITHVFACSPNWDSYTSSVSFEISDFTPPSISLLPYIREQDQIRIRAQASGAYTGFVYYKYNDTWYTKEMNYSGGWLWTTIPGRSTQYYVQAQDEYFNFSISPIQYTPTLSNVIVYPNPYKPGSGAILKFKYLTGEATIKIYTIAGEPVRTIQKIQGSAPDYFAEWDGKNENDELVASGVYTYVITDNTGEKITGKIAVIK